MKLNTFRRIDKNEKMEENEYSGICSFNTEYFLCLTYSICGGMLDRHLGYGTAAGGTRKCAGFAGITE
jgi:hypothetical protein